MSLRAALQIWPLALQAERRQQVAIEWRDLQATRLTARLRTLAGPRRASCRQIWRLCYHYWRHYNIGIVFSPLSLLLLLRAPPSAGRRRWRHRRRSGAHPAGQPMAQLLRRRRQGGLQVSGQRGQWGSRPGDLSLSLIARSQQGT